MTEDKNEKSRSALLSKIMSGDFSGTDTEDDDIPLARYSAEKEKRRQLQNPPSRVDSKKKRRLNFLDNVSKKSSAADNSKQRENHSQDDLALIDEDILNQYKTSSEENKENKKCVHETVEVDHTGENRKSVFTYERQRNQTPEDPKIKIPARKSFSEGAKSKLDTKSFYGTSSNPLKDDSSSSSARRTRGRALFQNKEETSDEDLFSDFDDNFQVVDENAKTTSSEKNLVSDHVCEVRVSPEVMRVCWSHALSNEKQEIMGLLIGNTKDKVVYVRTLMVGKRTTKESARVEVDDNELVEALMLASSLKDEVGAELRVVGWYHSHPHITVLPSRVDLSTQSGYQTLHNMFVGLIFSVYCTESSTKETTNRVMGFQAGKQKEDGNYEMFPIPIVTQDDLSMVNEEVFVSVFSALGDTWVKPYQEELEEYEKIADTKAGDLLANMHNDAVLTTRLTEMCRNIMEPGVRSLQMELQDLKALGQEQMTSPPPSQSALSDFSDTPSSSSLEVKQQLVSSDDLTNQHEDGIRQRKFYLSTKPSSLMKKNASSRQESVSRIMSSKSEKLPKDIIQLDDDNGSEKEPDAKNLTDQHASQDYRDGSMQRNIITCSPVNSTQGGNSSNNESSQESNSDRGNSQNSSPWGFESQNIVEESEIVEDEDLESDEESTSRVYTDSQEF